MRAAVDNQHTPDTTIAAPFPRAKNCPQTIEIEPFSRDIRTT